MAAAKSGYNVEVGMNLSPFEQGLNALRGMGSRITGAFNSASSAVSGLVGKIFTLKNAVMAAAGAAGLYGLERAIAGCVKAASQAEDAEMGLANALHATGNYTAQNVQELGAFASERQRVTRFEDDATVAAMANLATFRLSAQEIRQLIPAVQDLAAAKGMDLLTATQLVGRAITGEGQELRRYGIEIERTGGAATAVGDVLQSLSVYAGRAEAEARTGAGAWAMMANAFGDVREAIGDFFLKSESGRAALTFLTDKIRELVEWIGKNKEALAAWIETGIKAAADWVTEWANRIAEFVKSPALFDWLHRAAIAWDVFKMAALLALTGIKGTLGILLGACWAFVRALDGIWYGMKWLYHKVIGGAMETRSALSEIGDVLGELSRASFSSAADSAEGFLSTWDNMWAHARSVGSGVDETAGPRRQTENQTNALRHGLADQNAVRAQALQRARRELDDFEKWVEGDFKKETQSLQKQLDEQIKAREEALKEANRIGQDARQSGDTAMQKRFDLYTKDLKGSQLTQLLGRMERLFLARAKASEASGFSEEALRRLADASGYVEKAYEQAKTGGDRSLLLNEMRRIERERQRIYRDMEATNRARAAEVQQDVERLQAKLSDLQNQTRRRLELFTNFPELAAQVERIRLKIQEITGQPFTIRIQAQLQTRTAGAGSVQPFFSVPVPGSAAFREEAAAFMQVFSGERTMTGGERGSSAAGSPALSALGQQLETLRTQLRALTSDRSFTGGRGGVAVIANQIDRVQQGIDRVRATPVNIESNLPQLERIVQSIRANIEAISNQRIEVAVPPEEGHAAGGWIRGGTPGLDSVRALLTPGEYVVNARSAAMNRAALEAINAGFAMPARFARGGMVPGGSVAAARESTTVNVTFNGPGDRQYIRDVVIPGISQAVRRGRAGSLVGRG